MKKITKIIIFGSLGLMVFTFILVPYLLIRGGQANYEFIELERATLKQIVSATGKIKPVEKVDLSFEKAGQTSQVLAAVGQQISQGQALVKLDTSELLAQLAQYRAALSAEQAQLAELKKGSTEEEIQLAQTKSANAEKTLIDALADLAAIKNKAEIDLNNAYFDVEDTLQDAYAQADNAVNKQIDDLFANDNTDHPSLTFSTTDGQKALTVESQRVSVRNALADFKNALDSLTAEDSSLDNGLAQGLLELNVIRNFLTDLTDILNITAGLNQTTVNTYKGYASTARDNVNTALSAINNQEQTIAGQKATNQKNISTAQISLTTAQNNLRIAQDELKVKIAGPTPEQIQAQEAQIEVAKANIENTQAQLAKMTLYSPIDGLIVKQEAKVGEIITAQEIIVSIISKNQFETSAYIPEVDIAKINLGNPAEITLDAYNDSLIFKAQVSQIDPAETIIEGVATYKTTLQFQEQDERIKSGMTANIEILTAQKENVLAVPYRAIVQKNGQKFVRVLTQAGKIQEIAVETGLRASDGNIEIINSLKPGDKVITYLEE